jgi:hypothetical protein
MVVIVGHAAGGLKLDAFNCKSSRERICDDYCEFYARVYAVCPRSTEHHEGKLGRASNFARQARAIVESGFCPRAKTTKRLKFLPAVRFVPEATGRLKSKIIANEYPCPHVESYGE